MPKDILSPRWIFEYELASPVEDIGADSAIKIELYGTLGDVITEEIKIQESAGRIVLEHSNRYRVQYNLEDVGLAVFKAGRQKHCPIVLKINHLRLSHTKLEKLDRAGKMNSSVSTHKITNVQTVGGRWQIRPKMGTLYFSHVYWEQSAGRWQISIHLYKVGANWGIMAHKLWGIFNI